jgi:DNA-binding MarR family transcriptional regulator
MSRTTVEASVTDDDYARLLTVRTGLRRFERWSAEQAAAHGLTAGQHQLLLAVRGHADPKGPTVGEVADYLLIRHHSAVELAVRTERAGLIERVRDTDDLRTVRLHLSTAGEEVLAALTSAHLEELAQLSSLVKSLTGTLTARRSPTTRPRRSATG